MRAAVVDNFGEGTFSTLARYLKPLPKDRAGPGLGDEELKPL